MSAVKATEVARGRWQLDDEVTRDPCGCRWVRALDEGRGRRVATCWQHGRHRHQLHPWIPA